MGLLFGILGVLTMRMPIAFALRPMAVDNVVSLVEIRSMFFGTVFMAVLLILAYLTNPTEASFRTFLTELSFRRHLSKLNEAQEADFDDPDKNSLHYTLPRHETKDTLKSKAIEGSTPTFRFHFANRASISLRTPSHIFRSFGILTVAAVTPITDTASPYSVSGKPIPTSPDSPEPRVAGSWFIGAFGKWWMGGTVELLRKDAMLLAKEDQDSRAGVLLMRSLDRGDGLDGLKFKSNSFRPIAAPKPTKRKTSRAQASEAASQPHRSTTPPPLPKSASLPLHAPRVSPESRGPKDRTTGTVSHPTHLQPNTDVSTSNSNTHSRSSSVLFEQSPAVAEILKQLTSSQSIVTDLRTQLSNFQSATSTSHASLQESLATYKARKREEDASRLELKSRTKALEDSKRQAESTKREAEKKLKSAQAGRDSASNRIARLSKDIEVLQQRVADDKIRVQRSKSETTESISQITQELEQKRQEIKVAEDVVAALGQRARELEDKIAAERVRLQKAQEDAAARAREARASALAPRFTPPDKQNNWPPNHPPFSPFDQPLPPGLIHRRHAPPAEPEPSPEKTSPTRPRSLSLNGISNLQPSRPDPVAARAKGYSLFSSDLSSLSSNSLPMGSNFSPFSDSDVNAVPSTQRAADHTPLSPSTADLIPSSLFRLMDEETVPVDAIRGNQDTTLPRPIERPQVSPQASPIEPSDTSLSIPISPVLLGRPTRPTMNRMDSQRATLSTRATVLPPVVPEEETSTPEVAPAPSRKWFQSSAASLKEKTGLNPEAKVFNFSRSSRSFIPTFQSTGTTPALPSATFGEEKPVPPPPPPPSAMSTFFNSIRAFAPSPAEREALSRALGTGNTSHELLSNPSESPNASSTALHLGGRLPPAPFVPHATANTHGTWPLMNGNGNGHSNGSSLPETSGAPHLKSFWSPWRTGWHDEAGSGGP